MSTIEEEVISWVALSGDLDALAKARIGPEHFLDPANAVVYRDMLDYRREYTEAPTPDALLRDHPNYPFVQDLSGPIEYLLDRLHAARRRTLVDLGLMAVAHSLAADDVDEALARMHLTLSQVAVADPDAEEVAHFATAADRLEIYRAARENPTTMLGVPTGFTWLDDLTMGIQPQHFVVLTGIAKSCKTTAMLAMARAAHAYGVVPMIISFEMSQLEISRRIDAFTVGVNPRKMQTGETTDAEWRALTAALMREVPHDLIVSESTGAMMTLDDIARKIDAIRPDIVFIDGAYFLRDSLSGETQTPIALTNICRGLKRLARATVPIVATTQSLASKIGQRGLTSHSAGYTSAWEQDADLMIGMESTDEPELYRMRILTGRNVPRAERFISIGWDPPRIEEETRDPELDLVF